MSKQLSFLDLPSNVRRKIYEYVGITGKIISLNWQGIGIRSSPDDLDNDPVLRTRCYHDTKVGIIRREDYHTLDQYWEVDDKQKLQYCSPEKVTHACEDCFNWDNNFQIMFTCHAIFVELYKMVYEKNRFHVYSGSPGGFEHLIKLRGYSLRALTHLTIQLDGEPPERINMSHHWTRTAELLPLRHYSRYGKQTYKQWADLIARLSESSLVPGRLNLFLLATVSDEKEAELVLRPLQSLPTLKSCGICLNSRFIPALKALIKKTAESLVTPGPEDADKEVVPFRYLDLPVELRLRILGFSDLLTSANLEWRPAVSSLGPILINHCSCCEKLGYPVYRSDHLKDCRPIYEEICQERLTGLDHERPSSASGHCCCCACERVKQSRCTMENAYMCFFGCQNHSSFTATKPGWKFFCHPLFLVSRQVRQDAIAVFFPNHRFILTPLDALPLRHLRPGTWDYHGFYWVPMPRTELSFFLSSIAKDALRYIRYLEWVFPPFRYYQSTDGAAYRDHLDTVEMMVQAMNLPNLTLVLNMRTLDRLRYSTGTQHIYRQFDIYSGNMAWSTRCPEDGTLYKSILGPLCLLGENGLKDCWVYLKNIWKERPNFDERSWHHKYDRDEDEMRWEKTIMGNESYDAFRRGKPWRERVERKAEHDSYDAGCYSTYHEEYPVRPY